MGSDSRMNKFGADTGLATGRAAAIGLAALAIAYSLPLLAQEGHPLKGSWIGQWESNQTHGESVLVILDWDGQNIEGVINPGTDNIRIDQATLDPQDWTVRLEADAPASGNGSGNGNGNGNVRYVIEGRIQNLELPSRSIVGTWQHDTASGDFTIQRQ